GWSVVHPNVLPPRQSAATFRPVRPSLRISMEVRSFPPSYAETDKVRGTGVAVAAERGGHAVSVAEIHVPSHVPGAAPDMFAVRYRSRAFRSACQSCRATRSTSVDPASSRLR